MIDGWVFVIKLHTHECRCTLLIMIHYWLRLWLGATSLQTISCANVDPDLSWYSLIGFTRPQWVFCPHFSLITSFPQFASLSISNINPLVPGNKPLPEPILSDIHVAICGDKATMSSSDNQFPQCLVALVELTHWLKAVWPRSLNQSKVCEWNINSLIPALETYNDTCKYFLGNWKTI